MERRRVDPSRTVAGLVERIRIMEREERLVEPVISAAVLAASAFRTRDQDNLAGSLRILVSALDRWDAARQPAEERPV